jgi:GMP synthase (glutamine-hydrolysing)
MAMTHSPAPRLLLLQIRHDPRVREEEYQSFVRYCGVSNAQIDILNVFDTHPFGPEQLQGYDALLVGGASEASVLEPEKYPAVPTCIELLRHCIDADFPVFASCFGFQLAVLALGGEIIRDNSDYEMGSLPISLRPAAARDLLFQDVPDGFHAVSVHRERSVKCPPGATELAYTNPCCHAFKVNDRRFWACQFHPEVDRATLVSRLTIYKESYTDGDDHLDEVLSAAVETPESNALIKKFVDRVLR